MLLTNMTSIFYNISQAICINRFNAANRPSINVYILKKNMRLYIPPFPHHIHLAHFRPRPSAYLIIINHRHNTQVSPLPPRPSPPLLCSFFPPHCSFCPFQYAQYGRCYFNTTVQLPLTFIFFFLCCLHYNSVLFGWLEKKNFTRESVIKRWWFAVKVSQCGKSLPHTNWTWWKVM